LKKYFEIDHNPKKKDIDFLIANLISFNKKKLTEIAKVPIALWYKNVKGEILGGISGNTFGKWLRIKYIWVDESEQLLGVGSNLLSKIEEEATKKNCQFSFVDTYDFQARPFYLKNGYVEIFSLQEYPIGGKRHYFTKKIC